MKENEEAKVVVVSVGNGGNNIAGSILKKEKKHLKCFFL